MSRLSARGGVEIFVQVAVSTQDNPNVDLDGGSGEDWGPAGKVRGVRGGRDDRAGPSGQGGVPGAGLEPARPRGQRILSAPRLPFRQPGSAPGDKGLD